MTTLQLLEPLRGKGDLHTAQVAVLWGVGYQCAARKLKALVSQGHVAVRGCGLRVYRVKDAA